MQYNIMHSLHPGIGGKMKRLTVKREDGRYTLARATALPLIYRRLGEYEDAEEQGLLLRLPCKIGDVVWHISGMTIEVDVVNSIEVGKEIIFIWTYDDTWLGEFGKTVFLTREEAEAALKAMQEGEQMEATSNFCIEGYIEIVDPEEAELMMQQEGKQ